MTDVDLVIRAQRGDLEAFSSLVERYQDAMVAAAYAILGNSHDAEDAAQEAFVQAWRALPELRDPDSFPGWLYRITQNRCRNLVARGRPARPPRPLGDAESRTALAPDPSGGALHEALAELSEANRIATALHYFGGYSVEEVAAILGVPSGTVKRRLHDARRRLAAALVGMLGRDLRSRRPSRDNRFAGAVAVLSAVWSDDAHALERWLRADATLVAIRDAEGWTPLHHAARRGHRSAAETLLRHGADPTARESTWGWTPLHLAAHHGHREVAALLEADGVALDLVGAAGLGRAERVAEIVTAEPALAGEWGRDGSTPLHWAAYHGHAPVVQVLLDHGARPDQRSNNSFRNTPLHCAVLGRHAESAALLLSAGASPTALDGHGATPLHALVKYPHEPSQADARLCDLLLAYGAPLDLPNEAGETALHWAATRGEPRLADLLLARGARLDVYSAAGLGRVADLAALLRVGQSVDAAGPDGMTALHFAAYGGSVETTRVLIVSNAHLEARGGWFGGTPLHLAVYQGRSVIVDLLLEHGADPHARDAAGWTPLHQFRFAWWTPPTDRAAIARRLIAAGAAIDARDDEGATPLHRAASSGDLSLVETLLAADADPNARDLAGRGPIEHAALANQHPVGSLLAVATPGGGRR